LLRINDDPQAWLLNQLTGPSRLPAGIASLPNSATILVEVDRVRKLKNEAKKANSESKPEASKLGRTIRRFYMDQLNARYVTAAESVHPFHERLVHFWSNHFAVSADKPPIPALAGAFENEAIRANISGKFSDMLLAAKNPPGDVALPGQPTLDRSQLRSRPAGKPAPIKWKPAKKKPGPE